MMHDEALEGAFKAALAADRTDLATRRAYADFLEERGRDDEALMWRAWTPERQAEAIAWIDAIGEQVGLTHEAMVSAAKRFLDRGWTGSVDVELPDELLDSIGTFWKHFATITDRMVPGGTGVFLEYEEYLPCSC